MKRVLHKKSKERFTKILALTAVWWALFYPDLYLVKDVCSMVERKENGSKKEVTLEELYQIKPDQIVLKSKAYEVLQKLLEETR